MNSQPASAADGGNYYDLPLCMPGFYETDPGDCLPLGPSETIAGLRQQGFPYPLAGLPANTPDPALNALPIRIASINEGQTKVYASLSDATSGGTVIRSYPGGQYWRDHICAIVGWRVD